MVTVAEDRNAKDMETRKVQKLGSSSLFITLPKKWINKWKINPGDKIIMEVLDDGTLKLVAEKIKFNSGKKSITLDIDTLKQPMTKVLTCLYSLGYDEIVFESKKPLNPKEVEEVSEFSRQLVGAELTESSETRVKLECLLDIEKIGLESLLRRILNIVSKKIDNIIAFLSNQEIKEIYANQEDLRKIYLMLLRRTVGDRLYGESDLTKNSFVIVNASLLLNTDSMLDKLMDYLKRTPLPGNVSESVKLILGSMNDLLDEIVMSILFPSIKRISNGNTIISQIKNIMNDSMKNSPEILLIYISQILSLMENALSNSSCTIFLEDLPWIERNLTG
jgi:phosphate uptake regulator